MPLTSAAHTLLRRLDVFLGAPVPQWYHHNADQLPTLNREKGAARRHLGASDGGQSGFVSFTSNPMYERIRWRELPVGGARPVFEDEEEDDGWAPLEEEFGTDNCLEITAYGKTTQYPTWFLSKESVERFLDVLSAQVKLNTSAEVFAEVVAAFMHVHDVRHDNIVAIVGEVWRYERSEVAKAIALLFLADLVPDPSPPVITEAADGWVRVLIRSGPDGDSLHDKFVLWHLPPDVKSHLTMVVASPQDRVPDALVRWRTVDPMSLEYVPPWSRLITSSPTCSLLYGTPQMVLFPRRAHRGRGVTCVEYACLRGEGDYDVQDATALAKLFKNDADPIVVGLGFQALKRLQTFSRHGELEFHPYTSNDHHWHVVWPKEYKRQFQTPIRGFFTRLIRLARPGHKVGCRRVPSGRAVRRYEFFRWENDDAAGDNEPIRLRFYDCLVDRSQIMFKIAPTSMLQASDAETEVETDDMFIPDFD
jgi:hypothetical protein